jgi:hypothetical protein
MRDKILLDFWFVLKAIEINMMKKSYRIIDKIIAQHIIAQPKEKKPTQEEK